MVFFEKTFDELIGEAINNLQDYTNITQKAPGSKARALLEIVMRETNNAYRIFDQNLAKAFLNGATGRYLNYIGELFGLSRLTGVTASIDLTQEVVKFYVESGSFGTINSGNSIVIPQGTIIETKETEEGLQDNIEFVVAEDTTLLSSNSEQFISLEAVIAGTSSNVGVNSLVQHDFVDYTDYSNNTLKVTNVAPVTNGREPESDVNYRFRISKAATSAEAANETAVRLAVLAIPGVADATIIPHTRGIGTAGIYIKSTSITVPPSLIASVQAEIDRQMALGNMGFALEPTLIGLEMVIKLNLSGDYSVDELTEIENNAIVAVEEYVNNLDIGEDFIQQELVKRVLLADDRIQSLGTNYAKPIDELYLYRESLSEDNRSRSGLLGDYEPASTERVVLEPSVASQVIIRL
jgi:uncharacterized phage protein gp47/JayE